MNYYQHSKSHTEIFFCFQFDTKVLNIQSKWLNSWIPSPYHQTTPFQFIKPKSSLNFIKFNYNGKYLSFSMSQSQTVLCIQVQQLVFQGRIKERHPFTRRYYSRIITVKLRAGVLHKTANMDYRSTNRWIHIVHTYVFNYSREQMVFQGRIKDRNPFIHRYNNRIITVKLRAAVLHGMDLSLDGFIQSTLESTMSMG